MGLQSKLPSFLLHLFHPFPPNFPDGVRKPIEPPNRLHPISFKMPGYFRIVEKLVGSIFSNEGTISPFPHQGFMRGRKFVLQCLESSIKIK